MKIQPSETQTTCAMIRCQRNVITRHRHRSEEARGMSLASKSLWDLEPLSPIIVTFVTIGFRRAENRCPINHIYVVQAPRDPPCAWGRARTNYSRSRFRIRFRWLPAFPLLIPQKMAVCCWLVCSLFLFALGLKTSLGEGGKYTIKQSIHYAGPFLSFIIWIGFLGARHQTEAISMFCKLREGGSVQTRANTSTRHSQLLFLW